MRSLKIYFLFSICNFYKIENLNKNVFVKYKKKKSKRTVSFFHGVTISLMTQRGKNDGQTRRFQHRSQQQLVLME